jgi:hypothetical protein
MGESFCPGGCRNLGAVRLLGRKLASNLRHVGSAREPASEQGPAAVSGPLVLVLLLLVGAAVAGLAFGGAVSMLASWPAATVPACPDGSSLYTRSVLNGRFATSIQHCFRDSDAQDLKPQP